jgi:hypothetical protein
LCSKKDAEVGRGCGNEKKKRLLIKGAGSPYEKIPRIS